MIVLVGRNIGVCDRRLRFKNLSFFFSKKLAKYSYFIKVIQNKTNIVMKKLFMVILAAIMMFSFASCNSCSKDDVKFGVEYALNINGDADGDVAVTFDQGALKLNGTAALDFVVSNMDTVAVNGDLPLLDSLLISNDLKTVEAAEAMSAEVDKFAATAASGTYDLYLKGRVRERVTGLEARV